MDCNCEPEPDWDSVLESRAEMERDGAAAVARWAELREHVKAERDLLAKMAAEHQSTFFNAKSDAYGWVLATMDRMETGR